MPVCQFQHQRSGTAYYNRLALLVKQRNNLAKVFHEIKPQRICTLRKVS